MDKKVLLIGTLDTKGREFDFLNRILKKNCLKTIVMDCGVLGKPFFKPDIPRNEVALHGGTSIEKLQTEKDRGHSMEVMVKGVVELTGKLYREGRICGVMGIGGGSGTNLACSGMKVLPVGFPKIMVSTMASGNTGTYIGEKDIMMVYSVADILGLNRVTRIIISNAAAAMTGIIKSGNKPGEAAGVTTTDGYGREAFRKYLIAATMMGATTPCLTHSKAYLEERDFEVIAFHTTGSGGRAMENLISDGVVNGVLDITTTEIMNTIAGGVFPAGEERISTAAGMGIPIVVSCGALDFVNFWTGQIPEKYRGRDFHQHNPVAVLMRTSEEENIKAGRVIAERLNKAKGPAAVVIPLMGFSSYDAKDMPFYDREADMAFIGSLEQNLNPGVEILKLNNHINDAEFAERVSECLIKKIAIYDKEQG